MTQLKIELTYVAIMHTQNGYRILLFIRSEKISRFRGLLSKHETF